MVIFTVSFNGLIAQERFAKPTHKFELTPIIGYTFGNNFNIYGGRARLSDGFAFGGIFGMKLNAYRSLEFMYSRQNSNGYAESVYLNHNIAVPLAVNYFLFGLTQQFPKPGSNVVPFTGLKFGWVTFNPRDFSFSSVSKFAANFTGGIKYNINNNVDIRTALNLFMPVAGTGTQLWWSPGSGTAVGVSGSIPFVQFNFQLGMGMKF